MIAVAYAIGTFPTAQLVGSSTGHDPTTEGSGNPGASNTFRVAGARAGAVVLLGDMLKGAVSAGLGWAIDGRTLACLAGAAAVTGHVLPATRGLRGGKGVATFGGMAFVLYPFISLALVALFAITVKLTRKAAVGSLAMVVVLPLLLIVFDHRAVEVQIMAAIAALVVVRHWHNIKRLITRKEHALRG